MNTIDIPFKKLYPEDIPRPWLPVKIHNPHSNRSMNVYGLIDTGADECAVPAEYAPVLGHDLQAGIRKTINTGNGPTTAYAHTLCFETDSIKIDNVLIRFYAKLKCDIVRGQKFFKQFYSYY